MKTSGANALFRLLQASAMSIAVTAALACAPCLAFADSLDGPNSSIGTETADIVTSDEAENPTVENPTVESENDSPSSNPNDSENGSGSGIEPADSPSAPASDNTETETPNEATESEPANDEPALREADTTTNGAETSGPSVSYEAKIKGQPWQEQVNDKAVAGSLDKGTSLKAIKISVSGPLAGSVQYQAHLSIAGWTGIAADGAKIATSGNSVLNAIRIAITGELSKQYYIRYRTRTTDGKWLSRVKSGAISGNVDGPALSALEIELVKRSAPAKNEARGIVGVRYQTNTASSGWASWQANNEQAGAPALSERLYGFKVELDRGTYTGNVKYNVRLKNGKWKDWSVNGAETVLNKNVEALRIKITGKLGQDYDVVYRVYVDSVGWQRRMRNGEVAGTSGTGLGLRGLRIELVPKSKASGWIKSDEGWTYYNAGTKVSSSMIDTDESPINATVSGKHRYWLDSNGLLAVSRYVNSAQYVNDTGAGYIAFASSDGYLWCGKRSTEYGLMLSDAQGKIYTKTQWLKTDLFDGAEQRYRLVKTGTFAIVQTGLFTVKDKKFYGWEDGRGYVMRSQTWWINGNWYKANANGVLTNTDNQTTKHIERYVKWAIGIARDESHGYSQYERWGPDYDCSSFVVSALKAAGFPESGATWTGNMKAQLKKIGFVWHKGTSGLCRGDILLVHNSAHQHTEIYLGDNKLVGAHSSETGGISGKTGDQTGREISVTGYYNMPWSGYLRYKG